ncbi:MAG: polymer-forming cytoskeletal protein, partial [bacterium]|nr:polymer-forming cytoskeletal protein [bacterium]
MPENPSAAPVATPPVRPKPVSSKHEVAIGKTVVINGDIISKEDLCLNGQVSGTIDVAANQLTVGLNGKVEANIKAREVIVLGAVSGDIQAVDKITIAKDAHLEGNLKSASISIEDGAYFKGSIDIVRPAPVKAQPEVKPARPEPTPPSPAPTVSRAAAGG